MDEIHKLNWIDNRPQLFSIQSWKEKQNTWKGEMKTK